MRNEIEIVCLLNLNRCEASTRVSLILQNPTKCKLAFFPFLSHGHGCVFILITNVNFVFLNLVVCLFAERMKYNGKEKKKKKTVICGFSCLDKIFVFS